MPGTKLFSMIAGVAVAGTIAATLPAPDAAGADPVTVRVVAEDYSFTAPAKIAAGPVRIEFLNKGKEFHHAWLVRLDEGKTRADFEAAMAAHGPIPGWMVAVGGPNAPSPEGGTSNATLVLKPGNYIWTCIIPGPDGKPHLMKGMTREMTVTSGSKGDLPKADAAIILSDYAFDISKPLKPGRTTLRVVNYAAQPHELVIMKMAPGSTVESILHWIEKTEGPPQATLYGGVTPIGKTSNNIEVDFEAGRYLLICFAPDIRDGQPHFVHGMTKVITIE